MPQFNESTPLTQTMVNSSSEAIMIVDANMTVTHVNSSFTAITGYEAAEVIGKTPPFLNSDMAKLPSCEEIWQCLNEKLHWQGEIGCCAENGEYVPQWLSISTINKINSKIKTYIAVFSDITERTPSQFYIRQLTDYDALTGLPGRFLLLQQLDELIAITQQKNEISALLFLDIDHFKTMTNSLGYLIGDKILVEMANLLSETVDKHHITARLGGDEFAILLTDLGQQRDAAMQIVQQYALNIRNKLSEPINIMGHNILITCGIGVVFFPNDAQTSEQLFKLADAALRQAKQEGRNQIQFITPVIAHQANRRMVLLSALHFALALNEFVLLFQPQYDYSRKLVSAEVLLRWEPDGQTMAMPDEFIPLAEENGMIIPIGIWIIRTVCQQIKVWISQGLMKKKHYIAINISPKQFVQPDFVEVVSQIVSECGIKPCNLELELTEGLLIKNVDESVAKLQALKAQGFRISIDDFGTGYSSLAYLKRFPLDSLKIDRSFVTAIDNDTSNAGIVQAIVAMARALKFDTVAEGVETQAEFDFLNRHHCDLYQGYLFSKPLRLHEFDQLLRAKKSL